MSFFPVAKELSLIRFSDNEIMLYMLQLVQALKYELYNDSPLVRFLVKRGLSEPKFVGHQLFWQLMSEAHISYIRHRFSAILVNFIYGIGSFYSDELLKGYAFTQKLVELNQKLSKFSHSEATMPFRKALSEIVIPSEFHLPMDPRLVVDSFIIDECKVMNSKKKPFWLSFKNASPFATEHVLTMFKVGDDLRQDQLTLQLMKVMEYLWREKGYNYHMKCYGVLPTGLNQGFIEIVPYAKTEASIQQEKGALSGVLDKETFSNFLKKHNPSPKAYESAKENFRLSSAGYAVATCVLGIADRHPGNIMIQRMTGNVVHIDFGDCFEVTKERAQLAETIPFRLTRNIIATLGPCSIEGSFRRTFEEGIRVIRDRREAVMSILEIFIREPITSGGFFEPLPKNEVISGSVEINDLVSRSSALERLKDQISRISEKINGLDFENDTPLTVSEQTDALIKSATDTYNLSCLYHGWNPLW